MSTVNQKIKITKCICYNTTFEEMKKIMNEKNLKTIGELREHKPVGMNCGLCLPYISRMIETGEVEFDSLIL